MLGHIKRICFIFAMQGVPFAGLRGPVPRTKSPTRRWSREFSTPHFPVEQNWNIRAGDAICG
jgi:hypothetical protein